MPDPAPEISQKIEQLLTESGEAFSSGQAGLGQAVMNEAWGLLPEPKRQWDFYSQAMSTTGIKRCRDNGLIDDAFLWLGRARDAYSGNDRIRWMLDGYEATLRYEAGAPDAAEYAKSVFAEHGPKAFKGEDAKYLRFAKTGQRSDAGAPANTGGSRSGQATSTNPIDTAQIEQLSEQGSDLLDDDWQGALALWRKALDVIPEPKSAHGEATWLYTSIGDAYHSGADWANAVENLKIALTCPDGTGSAYLWLRLGQSQYELGQLDDAANSLLSAYMLEGDEIYADEDPQYRQLLVDRGLVDV